MRSVIGSGCIAVICLERRTLSFRLDGWLFLLTAAFGIAMRDAGAQLLQKPAPRFGRINFAGRCNVIVA
jgi:hypothetical protein